MSFFNKYEVKGTFHVKDQQDLVISADETIIHNPSAIPVWVNKAGVVIKIDAGETVYL